MTPKVPYFKLLSYLKSSFLNFQNAKFLVDKHVGTKVLYLGNFRLTFEKTIAIFEIYNLEVLKI